jgi:uroporphyrinogen decarboxylase
MPRLGIRASGNRLGLPPPLWDSAFLRACRGEPTAVTPVWLMRQAGRYMAHYRGVRARGSFLSLCKDPAAAAEVALYAREWLGVDAAIVFSDILVVLEALGMPLEYAEGEGPRLPQPLTGPAHVESLADPARAAADLGYVEEAVRRTVAGLPPAIPCIGFCGGPFTLASYAIEGGSSRQFARTKAFMYRETAAWTRLMEVLTTALALTLNRQIAAGAACVQVFESWAGALTRADFAEFVAPHLRRLIAHVQDGVPVIAFGAGAAHLSDLFAECGPDVVGVDSVGDLGAAFALRSPDGRPVAVQGNLDPCLLLGTRARLLAGADGVLAAAGGRPGHIFNLGHGVLKESDPEQARALVAHVHESSARRAAPR